MFIAFFVCSLLLLLFWLSNIKFKRNSHDINGIACECGQHKCVCLTTLINSHIISETLTGIYFHRICNHTNNKTSCIQCWLLLTNKMKVNKLKGFILPLKANKNLLLPKLFSGIRDVFFLVGCFFLSTNNDW